MFKQQQQETKAFLDLLKRHTKAKIDLHFIHHNTLLSRKENKKLSIARNIDIADAYMVLKRENAWWKNTEKRENVYWSWSRETEKFNIAFVDDAQKIEKFIHENHFCLIQTSQNKYQGLFLLDDYVSPEKLAKVQKILCDNYNGDPGATGTWQLKRMPGFINTKYLDEPMVKVVHIGNAILKCDILQQHEPQPPQPPIRRPIRRTTTHKTWWDFHDGDYSQTDLRYALYLLHFHDPEEVYDILKSESPELYERKGASYIDEYIRRTVLKAIKYYRVTS
jgi:hypothetical protein